MAKFSSNSSDTFSDLFIDEGSDAIEYLAGGSVDLSCECNKDDDCEDDAPEDDDDWDDEEYEDDAPEDDDDWDDEEYEASLRSILWQSWNDSHVARYFGDVESGVKVLLSFARRRPVCVG